MSVPPETVQPQPLSPQPAPGQPQPVAQSAETLIMNKKPTMFELTKIVIPKILNEWEVVVEAFHYDIPTITAIKDRERGDHRKCCREFFKDWLQTNHGVEVGPKVWSTLLKVLKDVEISADIIEEITEKVKQL